MGVTTMPGLAPRNRLLGAPGSLGTAPVERSARAIFAVIPGNNCSQTLKIPAMGLPYIGRGRDPSLFQPSVHQHAETGDRLLVRLSYHGST